MQNATRPMPLPAPQAPSAHGPVLAAVDGSLSFRHWLGEHQDALYAWCLSQAQGRLDPEDFMAMAMAVGRERNASALTDWLLWAALMLARGRPRPTGADPQAPLPATLQRLLDLAATEALRSPDVLDLLQRPLVQVDRQMDRIALRSAAQASHLAA